MKKEDLCKIFLVYVCLFHVTPAHPCGENPLRRIISYASRTGKDVNRVLRILQEANEEIFQRLEREWQMYANCVGMVDTGYFKRSSYQKPALVGKSQGIPEDIPEGIPKFSPWFLKMMFQVLKDSDHKLETDDSDLITDWLTRSLTSDIDDVVSRKQRG